MSPDYHEIFSCKDDKTSSKNSRMGFINEHHWNKCLSYTYKTK